SSCVRSQCRHTGFAVDPYPGWIPTKEHPPMRSSIILVAGATLALAATAGNAATAAGPVMGSAKTTSRPAFQGYYDGHKDTYLNTDVSSKSDAAMMHVNYSARLASIKSLPEIYLVEGKAAPGQLAVFGSEPGEKTYSPLWAESILTWKAGAKPAVLERDPQ